MKITNVNTFKRACLASVFALTLAACGGGDSVETETDLAAVDLSQPTSDWQMVWSDEFEGDSINLNNWTHEVNCIGGGNQERQCYTDSEENSFIEGGMLNILAKQAEAGAAQPYTSARLNTRYKADFKYGRIEMRAKLPSGQGSWPAFWMLPTDYVYGGWPRSGEIDIMEAVNLKVTDPRDGSDQRSVYGTLHYGQEFPNNDASGVEFIFPEGSNPADGFHTYAIEWEEGEIRWYVDDFLYATQRRSTTLQSADGDILGLRHRGWYSEYLDRESGQLETFYDNSPFDESFHLILNLAVGGNWPENVNDLGIDADAFAAGQIFTIDYVRVFECAADPITGRGCETVRSGYDQLNEGVQTVVGFDSASPALIEGAAPTPIISSPGGGETIAVFEDGVEGDWAINACCDGNSTSEVITEDDGNQLVQFTTTGDAAVTGFDSRMSGNNFDITPLAGNGFLKFDVRVIAQPNSGADWLVKVESNGQCCQDFAEIALSALPEGAPVLNEWKSYSVPVSQLLAVGLEPTQVDAIFVFPGFTTGNGAVLQLDNVRFEGEGSVEPAPIFDGAAVEPWALNACCDGNASSEIVDDDGENVVQFTITGDASVVGFDSRAAEQVLDVAPFAGSGSLNFDVKVMQQPTSGADWLVKVEADGQCCQEFAELTLADLPEGAPVTGEWVSYSIPVSSLLSAGLRPDQVDAVFVFPGFTTGAGAVVRLRNVGFESTGGDAPVTPPVEPPVEPPAEPVDFAIGQEIISNGSFDEGTTGWTGGMMMPEGDNNVLVNIVSAAGDPWSVNASQVLPLDASTNYTLTFRAKATQARNIVAGIGLNAQPFSNDVETVALTTEWQTFTLQLSTLDDQGNAFSDVAARVLFDMGAEVGDVTLDDVSLVKSNQLIVNGGFDFGTNEWNGGNTVDEDGNNVFFATVATAGDSFSVNLSQVISLIPDRTYTVSFRAKASVDRTMIAGLGLNAAPWTASTVDVPLTTDWQMFTYDITTFNEMDSIAFGDDNSRVLFDMGAAVGDVSIDDVTVELKSGEMLTNRGFEDGIGGWNAGTAPAPEGNLVTEGDNTFYQVDVATAGDPWNVNLSQVVTLAPATQYILTFDAKGTEGRTAVVGLGLNAAPFSSNTSVITLGADWQQYTLLITTTTTTDDPPVNFGDDNSRVLFDMGADVGIVSLDNISLVPASAYEQLVTNTDFSDGINGYNGGMVMTEGDNSFFEVNVETAGNPWEANLSQVLTLIPNQQYVMSFKAKASVERGMIAGLGLNANPFTASTVDVALTTEWQTFTYTITTFNTTDNIAFGDDNSRVLFDMGAEVGMVSLDDILLFVKD